MKNAFRVSEETTRQIATRFKEEREAHATWSNNKIARKLGREFGLSPATVIRHKDGVAAIKGYRLKQRRYYANYYRRGKKQPAPTNAQAGAEPPELLVARKLLAHAADPNTPKEEIDIILITTTMLLQERRK